jgi:hypothetical protein
MYSLDFCAINDIISILWEKGGEYACNNRYIVVYNVLHMMLYRRFIHTYVL